MAKEIKDETGKRVHPWVPELCEQLRVGKCDRREFLRTTTLLGVSAATAYTMAGKILGEAVVPQAMAQEGKMGGALRVAMQVQDMTDPSTFDWTEKSNQARHIVEYLTITGPDNVTRPYLAKSWEASDDLKQWTLQLRDDVTWSNGDKFTADDVVYNLERWLDPATGSSNIGLFSSMVDEVETGETDENGNPKKVKKMTEGAVEKVDDHTVVLHLNRAELAIPENFYNYPTAILHRRFSEEGGDLSKNPVGTGPYELVDLAIGERCILKRRDGYWGKAPYLDEIQYIDVGQEASAVLAALASDQVDTVYGNTLDVNQVELIQGIPNVDLYEVVTAQTGVARMQMDAEPFTDKRIRQAILACMDHDAILQQAYRGLGAMGENHHVAPIHPEYFKLPMLKPDIEKAKALLAEAGHPDGIDVTIDVGSTSGPWELAAMQAFKQQCAPAGINLNLNVMPSAQYWEIWDKTPFGFTSWTHRPLGVMVLNLGYRSGVPWNESHYNNPDFDAALDEAGTIVDPTERSKAMEKVQGILQDDAIIGQPLWRSVFTAAHTRVKNLRVHPTLYDQFGEVWLDV